MDIQSLEKCLQTSSANNVTRGCGFGLLKYEINAQQNDIEITDVWLSHHHYAVNLLPEIINSLL